MIVGCNKCRSIFNVALFQLFVVIACAVPAFSADSIRFAPLPLVSATSIEQQFLPFVRHLAEISEQQVELVHYLNYQILIDDLAKDKIDLAYLGALPYVLLNRIDPEFIPVVGFVDAAGDSTYTCSLVRFDENVVLGELTSKSPIALPQPYSTCAYLMTERLLNQQHLSLKELPYYYAGNHSDSALDVIRGKAAVAGIKTSIAQQYEHLGLLIQEQDIHLPGHLLVANPRTISAEQIDRIRKHLLALDPRHNPKHKQLTAAWGEGIRFGAIPVEKDTYRYVDELLNEIDIPGVDK